MLTLGGAIAGKRETGSCGIAARARQRDEDRDDPGEDRPVNEELRHGGLFSLRSGTGRLVRDGQKGAAALGAVLPLDQDALPGGQARQDHVLAFDQRPQFDRAGRGRVVG